MSFIMGLAGFLSTTRNNRSTHLRPTDRRVGLGGTQGPRQVLGAKIPRRSFGFGGLGLRL